MTDQVLTVSNLRAWYVTRAFGIEREVRAVDDVSFSVARNEIYGLAGESSSGKTTLIKTIAAAIRPPLRVVDGSVTFNFGGRHIDMYRATPPEIAAIRWRHLSYIMQGSMSVLNPVRRVRHAFVDFAHRHIARPMPEFLATVRAHLQRLHLAPEVLEAYPHELSGGMRQRVTIALATICRPDFIIADEPTTALDVVVQKGVLAMIREIQQELGSSLLFVTHDIAVHANLSDRLGVMYAGRLVEEGPTAELLRSPRHPYTSHLVASLPRIGGTAPKSSLPGTPPNLADPPTGCRFHPRCPLAMEICRRETPPMLPTTPAHRVACFAVQGETS
jgi:peptide/nickel transport system ATP-binding protein